jgi:sulfite reductase alpha subunit-like flavoprotein
MAEDVHETLLGILKQHGMRRLERDDKLKELKQRGQYQVCVASKTQSVTAVAC